MTALGWCGRNHFQHQLTAAGRLWPAEAWRARTALLLSCGDPALETQARRALRARWGIDDVRSVVAPVRILAEPDPRAVPWLRTWFAREIHEHPATLIAVAAHPVCAHRATRTELQAAVAQIREWGVAREVEPLWLGS